MSLVESMITIKMSFTESTDLWPKVDLSKKMKIITAQYLQIQGYMIFVERDKWKGVYHMEGFPFPLSTRLITSYSPSTNELHLLQ